MPTPSSSTNQTAPTTASNAAVGWVGTDQTVTLTPGDSTGAGVAATQYCADAGNSCTPVISGTSIAVTCFAGATCQTYVRYRSSDQVGNVEATQSAMAMVRIGKAAPTNGTLTATPGNAQVVLSWWASPTLFEVIDVTNPAAPVLLSATPTLGPRRSTCPAPSLSSPRPPVFHTDTNPADGLCVLDVGIPTMPALVDHIIAPGLTRTVVATPTFVYSGDRAAIRDVI